MEDVDRSIHVLPNSTEVALLDCKQAFQELSLQERKYAHHLAQASFKGGLIVLFQTSPESPGIFILIHRIFRGESPEELKERAIDLGITDEEIEAFYIYAAAFYCNMGNYKSFGDTKFIPDIPKEKLQTLVQDCIAYQADSVGMAKVWESVKDKMYSLNEKERELGFGDKGTSTYYSANCDEYDAKICQEFLVHWNISPYNTRLFKTQNEEGEDVYEVRLASAICQDGDVQGYPKEQVIGEYNFRPSGYDDTVRFNVTRGDYSVLLDMVAEELEHAKEFAANETEVKMLTEYAKSFMSGSIPCHKDGSRHWIRNKGPIVETYIGFIESYRDPYGVRGEFEGFVAVVNKEMSAKFAKLVENAEKFLAHLPWPVEFEKDRFLRPDFTSLDVLAFGGSGIPAGINIPNYDDIRQSEGFKNVSLGNVITSSYKDTKITFLRDEDKELYSKYKIASFEVQVGLHELLGHGSGKLFRQDEDGNFNFDIDHVVDPDTGEKISSWYKPGETWDSKFSTISATYEECRAECVGIYLCLLTDVLAIFGHTDDDADDIIYVNWLNMVRAGILALEFYSPDTGSWRQAHMNARFVILRVLLEAGKDLVRIEKFVGEDQKPDLRVVLDRAKISTVGKPAIHNFLKKLQVYKSTANVDAGRKMYEFYSDVNDNTHPHFLHLRGIVLDRKQQRKLFVQPNTYFEDDDVVLKSYKTTTASVIESFQDRFPLNDCEATIQTLWEYERPFF